MQWLKQAYQRGYVSHAWHGLWMTSARIGDYLLVVPQHITRGQCTALPGVSCRRAVPVSVVLGTAGKALFALRHLLGPAVTPTKGVRRPLEHYLHMGHAMQGDIR